MPLELTRSNKGSVELTALFLFPMLRGYWATCISGKAPPSPKSCSDRGTQFFLWPYGGGSFFTVGRVSCGVGTYIIQYSVYGQHIACVSTHLAPELSMRIMCLTYRLLNTGRLFQLVPPTCVYAVSIASSSGSTAICVGRGSSLDKYTDGLHKLLAQTECLTLSMTLPEAWSRQCQIDLEPSVSRR